METKNAIDYFLFFLLIIAFLGQVYFYVRYFFKLAFYEEKREEAVSLPVSVVIAVKNEKENLEKNLAYFLRQNYKHFELVIVDDHSSDDTADFIKNLASSKVNYQLLQGKKGKKAAVAKGIQFAKHDSIILTDADCKPSSDEWMQIMAAKLKTSRSIVLGYGKYEKRRGLMNAIVRFETLQTALQYFSFALLGKAYMGVGRNLAYRKEVYANSKSNDTYAHIRSGDDDLLVNEMAESSQVEICLNPLAHTQSVPKVKWSDYFFQKRRHLQAGEKYKTEDRMRLASLGLSSLTFWLSFFLLCLKPSFGIIIFPIFAVKLMLQYFTYGRIMHKLQESDLLIWVPLLEFVYIFWMMVVGVSTWIWKVDRWK